MSVVSSASAQATVFADTFANGTVANADNYTGFWTVNAVTDTSITESGGALVVTTGLGALSSNLNPWINSAVSSDFNFFRRKLRLAATLSIGGAAPASLSNGSFAFVSSGTKSYAARDAVLLRFRADNVVFLGVKQAALNASPVAVSNVNNVTVPGTVTGFEMTLDAVNYTLKVYYTGGAGSVTYTGSHGLVAARWGDSGDSALDIEGGRGNGSSASSILTVSQLSVTTVDASTALFEDAFNNAVTTNSDTETGIWTTTAPQTSTATETNGTLTLVAQQAAAGSVIASEATQVASRFNFFNRPLRISVDVSAGGTVESYRRPNCLALASTTGNGDTASDVFYVGMTEGSILAGTKINSPGVNPQSTPSSTIKRLIGKIDNVVNFDYVALGASLTHFDLTIDAKRFQLTTANTGKVSGLSRFSGAHGLDRSAWGAAGDSALILESVRNSAAGANTTATTTWDNLSVTASQQRILADPYWDYTTTYATSTAANPPTVTEYYRVWVPSTERVIRGVILLAPGDGDDFRYVVHDRVAQDAARALGFALIGYRNVSFDNMNFGTQNVTLIKSAVQAVLDAAAQASGRPEISKAPLMITGYSRGAFDSSFLAAYWPERTIAFATHRGGSAPNSYSAAALKTPGLFMAGGADTNGTTKSSVLKPIFASWRGRGAQVAFAIDWRISHTIGRDVVTGMVGNQGWEAAMSWLSEVANLRYPRPMMPPTGANPTSWGLVNLADNSGWLGDTATLDANNVATVSSPFTTIAPYASYTGTILSASWLPNETLARMYQAQTSTDLVNTRTAAPLQTPLRIVSPAQYAEPVPVNQALTISVSPREFTDTRTITQLAFYDGATLLGTDTAGPDWSLQFTPATVGLHTLSVVATGSDGVKSSSYRILNVVPADFPPLVAATQTITLTADTAYTGSVAATDPEGDPVTYLVASTPAKGLVNVDAATGAYTYRAAHHYAGTDSFVLRASAGTSYTDVTVSVTVSAAADSNSNGLPDVWETANGVTNPSADPDGDGQTNLQEYLAGTNPKDASSVFKTTTFVQNPGSPATFTITWSAAGGVRYRVQYTNDLTAGFTDIVRPAAQEIQPGTYGVAGPASFTDDYSLTPPPGTRRFYRVRVVTGAE